MYDNMAKSGNAGDHKPLDINTYRGKGTYVAAIYYYNIFVHYVSILDTPITF